MSEENTMHFIVFRLFLDFYDRAADRTTIFFFTEKQTFETNEFNDAFILTGDLDATGGYRCIYKT